MNDERSLVGYRKMDSNPGINNREKLQALSWFAVKPSPIASTRTKINIK